jgi:hypothetical protein
MALKAADHDIADEAWLWVVGRLSSGPPDCSKNLVNTTIDFCVPSDILI